MKYWLTLFGLMALPVLAAVVISFRFSHAERTYARAERIYARIEEGMTANEVEAVVGWEGSEGFLSEGRRWEKWIFRRPGRTTSGSKSRISLKAVR